MRVALMPCVVIFFGLLIACEDRIQGQDSRPGTARSVHDFELKRINGVPEKLSAYKGKVALVVNVASECGFTPQYEGLQKLYERYSPRGFTVLGFPSNDFGKQEPGTDDQIFEFCNQTYGVKFPLFSKITVIGTDANPLYKFLQEESPKKAPVKWNFHKFLVDGDGAVIASFGSKVTPSDPKLVEAIETALAKVAPAPAAASRPANVGVRLLIVAFDGLRLPDGSTFSTAAEEQKRQAAKAAGKPYEPPPGISWHLWNEIRTEPTKRSNFLFDDPEFSNPGFTEADFAYPRTGVDKIGQRTVIADVKLERRIAIEQYTTKWNHHDLAVVLDGEIVMAPTLTAPLSEYLAITTPVGLSEEVQTALIERLRPGK